MGLPVSWKFERSAARSASSVGSASRWVFSVGYRYCRGVYVAPAKLSVVVEEFPL